MNFKACCGLLASKDDDDHDYDDVEHEPLPKPQRAADVRKKQQQHMSSALPGVYAAAGYSAKAVSRAASDVERTAGSSRDIQQAAWEAGAAASASASASGAAAHGHRPQHRQRRREDEDQQDQQDQQHEPRTMNPLTRGSSGGGGSGSGSGSHGSSSSSSSRAKSKGPSSRTTALSSSSGNASAGRSSGGQDAYVDARAVVGPGGGGGGSVRRRNNSGAGADAARPGTEAMRPGPKGAVGLGQQLQQQQPPGGSAGGGGTAYNASRDSSYSHSKRAGAAAVAGGGARAGAGAAARRSTASTKFDLAGFVEKLKGGLIVTKINRQGRAKVRTLFYDQQDRMLWWNEPGSRQRARGSASLLSISKKEQPLPVASLVKVRMADEMDEPFCFDGDVDKSFQLVFPARTVDLVAKDAEEASLLARGFQELRGSASAV